jgi:hypothetical protein
MQASFPKLLTTAAHLYGPLPLTVRSRLAAATAAADFAPVMPAAENTAGLRRHDARSCETNRLMLPESQSLWFVAGSVVSTLWLLPYLWYDTE